MLKKDEAIFAKLVEILCAESSVETLESRDVKREDRFEDLGIDSLDKVSAAMDAEKDFGITIPGDEMEKVKTVEEFEDLIIKLGGKA